MRCATLHTRAWPLHDPACRQPILLPCPGTCRSESDSRLGRSSRRPADQPLTTQYLTSRAVASPPRDPTASLKPTLNLLHPCSHAFPRVQSYRHGQGSSPSANRSSGSPTQLQGFQGQSPQPGSCGRAPQQATAIGSNSTSGGGCTRHVVQLPLDPRDVVETEQPRTLVAPQSIRQRHVLLFQNAQAMAAAASNSRAWIKPGACVCGVYDARVMLGEGFVGRIELGQDASCTVLL